MDSETTGVLVDSALTLTGHGRWRTEARLLVAEAIGVEESRLPTTLDWLILTTAPYLQEPPLSFYYEPAYIEYAKRIAEVIPDGHGLRTPAVSKALAGAFRSEHLAREFEKEDLSALQPTVLVRRYLARWYLDLCEQALDSLLELAAHSEAKQSKKGVPRGNLTNLAEFLSASGWTTVYDGYSSVVRNGIAHDLTFETESAGHQLIAVFTNDRGNMERRTPEEFKSDVELLVDRTLAYSLALRLFLLRNASRPSVRRLLNPANLPTEIREQAFRDMASRPNFKLKAASLDKVRDWIQLTIEVDDTTIHDMQQRANAVMAIYDAASWYPEADRVILGVSDPNRLGGWLEVQGSLLRRWAEGKISDQEFAANTKFMLFPFHRPFGRFRFKAHHVLSAAREEWRRQISNRLEPVPGLRLIRFDDTSTLLARRLRSYAVLENPASADHVRDALIAAIHRTRRAKVFRNEKIRRRWKGQAAHYADVLMFSREKRPRDLWADGSSDCYLGRALFRDSSFQGELPAGSLPEKIDDNTFLQVNEHWERARQRVPSIPAAGVMPKRAV